MAIYASPAGSSRALHLNLSEQPDFFLKFICKGRHPLKRDTSGRLPWTTDYGLRAMSYRLLFSTSAPMNRGTSAALRRAQGRLRQTPLFPFDKLRASGVLLAVHAELLIPVRGEPVEASFSL